MYDLGWTGPGFFDYAGDELALQHAISRYHAFVSLTIYYLMTSFIDNLLVSWISWLHLLPHFLCQLWT